MILWASVREGFDHTTKFSKDGYELRLSPSGKPVSPDTVYELEGRVAVLVHGYRSPLITAESAYGRMDDILGSAYDHYVKFLWPGSWEIAFGFMLANTRVKESARRLAGLIEKLLPARVDVWAHSLGCKVALESLHQLDIEAQADVRTILAAPAVDNDYLQAFTQYGGSDIRVAYSAKDDVLRKVYRSAPNNWFTPALGCTGIKQGTVRPPKTSSCDFTSLVPDHGAYRDTLEFYVYGLLPFAVLGHSDTQGTDYSHIVPQNGEGWGHILGAARKSR